MHDAIVVGSGAAGAFAALGLRGAKTLVLDVGTRLAEAPALDANLHDLRKRGPLFDALLGPRCESAHSIEGPDLSPKVKAPLLRPVIEAPAAAPGLESKGFRALLSYAAGGLANAWGAQVYRFDDADLRGFPLRAADLDPFYDEVTEIVGISGADDDLARFHGSAKGLQPPLDLAGVGRQMLEGYAAAAEDFRRDGVFLGRPRLAVLSRERDGRAACSYDNLEFFKPRLPAVYSPAQTLDAMVARGEVEYAPGNLVEGFRETEEGVEVQARDLRAGEGRTFRAKKLVLAAGALNTARLVLRSAGDTAARLPLVENPCAAAPLVSLRRIGLPLEKKSFYAQLNLFYSGPLWPDPVVGMIYATDGLLRADLAFRFPLSARGCIAAAKYILPAMAILQVFYPGEPHPSNTLGIDARGGLRLEYGAPQERGIEDHLLRALRRTGFRSSPRLVKRTDPGSSVHYAGPLPMRERAERSYETGRDGLLAGARAVYVADSASFPRLPAKNLTFTIMANALRIGRGIRG